MEFDLDPADEAFRQQVRQFLLDKLPADIAERTRRCYHPQREDVRRWTQIVYDQPWS
jgi:hypothetical protein